MTAVDLQVPVQTPGVARSVWQTFRSAGLGTKIAALWLVLVGVVAVVGPTIVPGEWLRQDLLQRNVEPGFGHGLRWLLGGDPLGMSLLGRVIMGTSASLVIGGASLVLSVVAGLAVGLFAGVYGRWVDDILMRFVDVSMSFPPLLLAVLFLYLFGPSATGVVVVLAATRWPVFARVVRAETIRLRELEFVAAYRVLSYGRLRVVIEGYLPNLLPPLLALAMVNLGQLILAESALSFLGLGVQAPDVSWGLIVAQGRAYTQSAWWVITFPGLAVLLTALSASYLSDLSSRSFGRRRVDPDAVRIVDA